MEVREAKIEGEGIIILCILVLPTIRPAKAKAKGWLVGIIITL